MDGHDNAENATDTTWDIPKLNSKVVVWSVLVISMSTESSILSLTSVL